LNDSWIRILNVENAEPSLKKTGQNQLALDVAEGFGPDESLMVGAFLECATPQLVEVHLGLTLQSPHDVVAPATK
jgi:hypothetical protein